MSVFYKCSVCDKKYDNTDLIWRCDCGGVLDLDGITSHLPMDKISKRGSTMWRYVEALPFDENASSWKSVTLGEGCTPLVPFSEKSANVLMKMEYMMPTFSYKDRGTAVLIAKAKELNVTKIVVDSSGNAGSSIAAYASRAGIECEVYVPKSTSPKKIQQISSHGATVTTIAGDREDTANAVKKVVDNGDAFYASHIFNPYFLQGTKTFAFELWEQMNGELPDVVVVPVGHGTLLLGAYHGFKELKALGMIDKLPRILGVQAEGCNPLAKAFENNDTIATPMVNKGTVAEGIASGNPVRSKEILAAIREIGGAIITAPESQIDSARDTMAKQGFYVEPTTASTFAGLTNYVKDCLAGNLSSTHAPLFTQDPFDPKSEIKVVIGLSGAGLKAN